jgi:hypothetical protein
MIEVVCHPRGQELPQSHDAEVRVPAQAVKVWLGEIQHR